MNEMTREELIELARRIMNAEGTERELDRMIELFNRSVLHPSGINLAFNPENYDARRDDISEYAPSPEEVVEMCLSAGRAAHPRRPDRLYGGPARRSSVFSYVDPEIRRALERSGRLVTLGMDGVPVARPEGPGPFIAVLGPIPLPRAFGGEEVVLHWYPFVRRVQLASVLEAADRARAGGPEAFRELLQTNMSVNSILACPGFRQAERPLVRVHSCCMTGDVFGSRRCECGPQLEEAFHRIFEEKGGAVVYMSGHEGRGIGLWAKAITYLLQDDGQDTYQANISLGLPEDSRDFTDAAVVLRYLLGGRPLRLLSNNPLKREHLELGGQPVAELVPFSPGICDHNLRYLRSKREKGHLLPDGL